MVGLGFPLYHRFKNRKTNKQTQKKKSPHFYSQINLNILLLSELTLLLEGAAQCKTLRAGLCKYILSYQHCHGECTEQQYKV